MLCFGKTIKNSRNLFKNEKMKFQRKHFVATSIFIFPGEISLETVKFQTKHKCVHEFFIELNVIITVLNLISIKLNVCTYNGTQTAVATK